tara:strand:+ start:636 stop:1502 length:867 start_codon:yes stop_codon:yes gene_type:complete
MKTVKKPTKAHKNKKVVKAHQGMAHVPKSNTTSTAPTRAQPTGARLATTDVKRPTRSVVDPSKSRPTKAINLSNATTRKNYTDNLVKDLVTKNPFNKPTRRPLTKAEKDQGMRYANPTGTLVSMPDPKPTRRPTAIDAKEIERLIRPGPVGEPMDERARRRRDNALKSELDEAMRQASKRPRRPRQPTVQPIRQPTPLRLPKDFGGKKRKPRQPRQQPPLIGTPVSFPQQVMTRPEVSYPQQFDPRILQLRNKGGVVKKKYAEVKTLKQGGYVSRAKYGSVDNLKKKK